MNPLPTDRVPYCRRRRRLGCCCWQGSDHRPVGLELLAGVRDASLVSAIEARSRSRRMAADAGGKAITMPSTFFHIGALWRPPCAPLSVNHAARLDWVSAAV